MTKTIVGKARYDFVVLRENQGVKQNVIAEELGISLQTLKNWLSKNRKKYEKEEVAKKEASNQDQVYIKEQQKMKQERAELDYWTKLCELVIHTLHFEFPIAPKKDTYFFDDWGMWLMFLNFDLAMWSFSFSEVVIMEFDGMDASDPFFDTRVIYGSKSTPELFPFKPDPVLTGYR